MMHLLLPQVRPSIHTPVAVPSFNNLIFIPMLLATIAFVACSVLAYQAKEENVGKSPKLQIAFLFVGWVITMTLLALMGNRSFGGLWDWDMIL